MKDHSLEFEKLFYKDGTPDELKSIQDLINSNSDIAKEYEMFVSFHNHIRKRDRVNESLKVLESEHNNALKHKSWNLRKVLWLIGLVLLSLGMFYILQSGKEKSEKNQATHLYAAYYEKPIIDLNSRSNKKTKSGIEYYQNSAFVKAITYLDTTGIAKGDQPLILLAKAISIHETSSMNEAQKAFVDLDTLYPQLESTISWYKALNYLKHDNMNLAMAELLKIEKTSYYYSKSIQLLKDLE